MGCSVLGLLLAAAVVVRPKLGWQVDRTVGPPIPHNVNQLLASQRNAPRVRFLGFQATTYYMWYGGPTMALVRRVTVPAWPGAAIALAVPAAWSLRRLRTARRDRRMRRGLCPSCGYDLRASSNRCPECGVATQRPAAAA